MSKQEVADDDNVPVLSGTELQRRMMAASFLQAASLLTDWSRAWCAVLIARQLAWRNAGSALNNT